MVIQIVNSLLEIAPSIDVMTLLKLYNKAVELYKATKITIKEDKQYIIQTFMKNIKDKEITLSEYHRHNGSEGFWLETQMGVKHNGNNKPDINGYEMKKSSHRITFGDYSASEYLFSEKKTYINKFNNWKENIDISKEQFIHYFGSPNKAKNDRFSWSGRCVPTYNEWNESGQKMIINKNNDILILYSYNKDKRNTKDTLPEFVKTNNEILIVIWFSEHLREKINNKFNINGFFICKKNGNTYNKICFGSPFNYEFFIENIKKKIVIFDSGMYVGNARNYSLFRSNLKFWESLIIDEY